MFGILGMRGVSHGLGETWGSGVAYSLGCCRALGSGVSYGLGMP